MRNAAIRRIISHLDRGISQLTDERQHSMEVWLGKAERALNTESILEEKANRPGYSGYDQRQLDDARRRNVALMDEFIRIRRLTQQVGELQTTIERMRDELSLAEYSVAGIPFKSLADCHRAMQEKSNAGS